LNGSLVGGGMRAVSRLWIMQTGFGPPETCDVRTTVP
jgi:hypothetical protein